MCSDYFVKIFNLSTCIKDTKKWYTSLYTIELFNKQKIWAHFAEPKLRYLPKISKTFLLLGHTVQTNLLNRKMELEKSRESNKTWTVPF